LNLPGAFSSRYSPNHSAHVLVDLDEESVWAILIVIGSAASVPSSAAGSDDPPQAAKSVKQRTKQSKSARSFFIFSRPFFSKRKFNDNQ
jgi:hypothetical protein